METSDSVAWEFQEFQHRNFLDLELNRIWEWKYRVLNNIWLPQHHQTQIKFLIQIWYKTTSRLKPNPWKLVIQEHGECEPFIHVFLIFRLTENMEMILQIHKSYIKSLASTIISKAQAPLQQVRHQHETVGEWRRKNERIGRYMRIILYGPST